MNCSKSSLSLAKLIVCGTYKKHYHLIQFQWHYQNHIIIQIQIIHFLK
jgi:hypothetical protein